LIVRRIVGYRPFEWLVAATALAELYATVRLFVDFSQPSFKLAEKHRDGARVHTRYHKPPTPSQRLLTDARTTDDVREAVRVVYATLDPVRLLCDMRAGQQRLVEIADAPGDSVEAGNVPALDMFLTGLRTAWQNGEARPTARTKPTAKRERRRPDPLLAVTPKLEIWFKAEPLANGERATCAARGEDGDGYPDLLLRTLQRRIRILRARHVNEMVLVLIR
jgi:hypothetical protein